MKKILVSCLLILLTNNSYANYEKYEHFVGGVISVSGNQFKETYGKEFYADSLLHHTLKYGFKIDKNLGVEIGYSSTPTEHNDISIIAGGSLPGLYPDPNMGDGDQEFYTSSTSLSFPYIGILNEILISTNSKHKIQFLGALSSVKVKAKHKPIKEQINYGPILEIPDDEKEAGTETFKYRGICPYIKLSYLYEICSDTFITLSCEYLHIENIRITASENPQAGSLLKLEGLTKLGMGINIIF